MKIIQIGASGTIGAHVYKELSQRHEVVRASRKGGDLQFDLSDSDSIRKMYAAAGEFDAVVCTAGGAHFGPFDAMEESDFYTGIRSKMMGQINLVMIGKDFVRENGSFTLISGITVDDPIRQGVGLSVANGAVNAFVVAAAIELKRGLRVNAVCPGLVEDSIDSYGPYFPGHEPIPMPKVVRGFLKSVEGALNGQVIKIYD